jgi:hypothetical protein
MTKTLTESDWDMLVDRIEEGKCTPFLGAGACAGILPLGSEVAGRWAKEHGYPLGDCLDLARVAQFLAIRTDPMRPKEKMAKLVREVPPPNFERKDEPHSVLAGLPFSIYITTNYDDFMVQALKYRKKDPKLEVCRWNKYIKGQPSVFGSDFTPTPASPVVFHLHGYRGVPESLVLTEDDYFDFLVNISREPDLIPPLVQGAMAGASLLFVGYRLADWDFRVLYRGVISSLEQSIQRLNVAVQLPPVASESEQQKIQDYLDEYFKKIRVQVYWGEAKDFVTDLMERWERSKEGGVKR